MLSARLVCPPFPVSFGGTSRCCLFGSIGVLRWLAYTVSASLRVLLLARSGAALAPDFGHCRNRELYSHINDTALYDVDTNGEQLNLAGDPQHADVEAALFKLITATYGSTPAAGV